MRVAALYDIHGNLPALEAVLDDVRSASVDRVVIGGDMIPGPFPRETLAMLLSLEIPTQFIRGNGEREVLEFLKGSRNSKVPETFHEAMIWNGRQLTTEHVRFLADLPISVRIEIVGTGEVLFCHATPRSDSEIFTCLTPDERVLPALSNVEAAVMVCGHTHMQFDRQIGDVRVVNAGSVGMPIGDPRACWLMLGPHIELRRTEYDFTLASKRVLKTTYPHAKEFASQSVLNPPSESEMLNLFERAAMK